MAFVQLIAGLFAALMMLVVSCGGNADNSSTGPLSLVRLLQGEKSGGECVFSVGLSQYPATYATNPDNCLQVVSIGPVSRVELEQMRQDVPLFWERSFPYQQALVGERIDGECDFSSPAVQAYLEFSETVSTDSKNCTMIVDVGPVTEDQIEKVQRVGGMRVTEVATPLEPVPSQ